MVQNNIKILKWFNFFTDFRLYAPVAVIYFSQVTGSFALGMSIFSLVMISSALFEIPTGIFSDRIGRKPTIILGAASAVLFTSFYAIGQSFWILAVGAILEGLSRSFYSGTNDALLHDTLAEKQEEHRYAEVLGKISSMFQVALAISAIFGSILVTWSFALIMWLSVVPQIVCLVLAFKLKEPQTYTKHSGNIYQHLSDAIAHFFRNKKLRLLSIANIMSYALGEATHSFAPAFMLTLWPIWLVGLLRSAQNIMAFTTFYFSGSLIKKFGDVKILLGANIINRITNITATAFPTIFSPLLLSTGSLFYGVVTVARTSLLQKEFTKEQRATMGSLNSFAGSLMYGVLAFLIGLIADYLSPANALLILSIIQIINVWLYWKLFKHR